MVTNLLLRFFWLSAVTAKFWSYDQDREVTNFDKFNGVFVMGMLAECMRRTQWALIRVENEQYNNFE
jgi:hypothetical protein